MNAITVTITGHLGRDPELRFTSDGSPVASFPVAVTQRHRDDSGQWEDGVTTWLRCSAWRDLGEHIAETLQKGDRVLATGTLRQREYTARDGTARTDLEMTVTDCAPSLKFATTKPLKTDRPD